MNGRILTPDQLRTIARIESEMAWIRSRVEMKAREIEALKVTIAKEQANA